MCKWEQNTDVYRKQNKGTGEKLSLVRKDWKQTKNKMEMGSRRAKFGLN